MGPWSSSQWPPPQAPKRHLSSMFVFEGDVVLQDLTRQLPEELQERVLWASLKDDFLTVLLPKKRGEDVKREDFSQNQNLSKSLSFFIFLYLFFIFLYLFFIFLYLSLSLSFFKVFFHDFFHFLWSSLRRNALGAAAHRWRQQATERAGSLLQPSLGRRATGLEDLRLFLKYFYCTRRLFYLHSV